MEERSVLTRDDFDKGFAALLGSDTARAAPPSMENANILTRDDWRWKEHRTYPGFGYLERKEVVRNTSARTSSPADASSRDGEDLLMNAADHLVEVDDEELVPTELLASMSSSTAGITRFLVDFYICLSPTFQVPILYFTAFYTTGSPLSLTQLLASDLFYQSSITELKSDSQLYPFSTLSLNSKIASSNPSNPIPFLSQGEHPTTGISCWFLHPCGTEALVREVLFAVGKQEKKGSILNAECDLEKLEEPVVRIAEREKLSDLSWQVLWIKCWLMIVEDVIDLRS